MTTIRGQLFRRGDEGYEQARTSGSFNARQPRRFPEAVLLAADEDDVVAGVRLARTQGWRVSVRAGGHSWPAWGVRDGALLIDLGHMREIGYDPASGIATAQPAVRGGTELAPFLAEHGRAFPVGHFAEVAVGGFLLGGGQGWNSRAWGWGCENVLAVDVVTADGERLRADAVQNNDLYWAARGAGPGFPAVVTRFHLRTHPKPAVMLQHTSTHHLADLPDLLAWLHEILPTLGAGVEVALAATRLADVPLNIGVQRPAGAVLVLHATAMSDTPVEAERLLAPFDECPLAGRRLGHAHGETDIARENVPMRLQNPSDHRYIADCSWSDANAEQLATALLRVWSRLPTEHSYSLWYGWAPTRPLPDMAFSLEANVFLATYAIYTDPADDERHAAWVHGTTAELARLGVGAYLADTDFTQRNDRFMTDKEYERLAGIRARRDPHGLFCSYLAGDPSRLNQHG